MKGLQKKQGKHLRHWVKDRFYLDEVLKSKGYNMQTGLYLIKRFLKNK